MRSFNCGAIALCLLGTGFLRAQNPLPGTAPLTLYGDLSAQMIAGIDRFLERETDAATRNRATFWQADLRGDSATYERSVKPNRERLARMLGVIDPRIENFDLELIDTVSVPAKVAEMDRFTVFAVRWPVLDGVHSEGLLLRPRSSVIAW